MRRETGFEIRAMWFNLGTYKYEILICPSVGTRKQGDQGIWLLNFRDRGKRTELCFGS